MEQAFADVTSGPLAHLPSGSFPANAAWLTCAAMAHNLVRAAGALVGLPFAKARGATIRRDLIVRTARHGRGHLTLHLPEGWHREQKWLSQEPRTSRTTGERQNARARNHLTKLLAQESNRKRATRIGRWIEA